MTSTANMIIILSGLGSVLVSIYGIVKNNKILKMCGLCTYSLLVVMNEIRLFLKCDQENCHPGFSISSSQLINLLTITLFVVQLILSWPIKGVEFNPATNYAAFQSRTKSVVGVLLINLIAIYIFWAREDVTSLCSLCHSVFCVILISRLIKYHKEREEELAKNPSPSELAGSKLAMESMNGTSSKEKKNKAN